MSAAATTLWARAFVEELARCGVEEVVIAPGSRSTPVVLALARHRGFRMRVHLDERSAAFFALGVGKASGRPAAVLTTSGTATANLYPAVVEAAQSETPLLVLTADRPPRLRGADANQAIDQVRMFGGYVRAYVETAHPEVAAAPLRHLRAQTCRSVAMTLGPPGGPVHVNLPFDKPLEPVDDTPDLELFRAGHPMEATGRPDGAPWVDVVSGARRLEPDAVDRLKRMLDASSRPVVVAGPVPRPEITGPAVARFANRSGIPLLADPLSGARWCGEAGEAAVAAYDLFLRDDEVRRDLEPDVVIRVGAAPTSGALGSWLADHAEATQVVVDDGDRWKDHAAVAAHYVRASALALEGVSGRTPERSSWLGRWRAAATAALAAVDSAPGETGEASVPALAVGALPAGGTLFISSSMPVRDLDAFAPPSSRAVTVLGNRGASGIDGIVSTAFGAARGPTVCVLGDLAFFHDQNGLLFSREEDKAVVFVLVDNDGGGIFHMLPVARHEPHFTPYFATPHGLDFTHTAALHGVPLRDVSPGEVGEAVSRALSAGGTHVVRVRTNREEARQARLDLASRAAGAARQALR